MPTLWPGYWSGYTVDQPRRLGDEVGRGKGRGITKPLLRRGRRKRR